MARTIKMCVDRPVPADHVESADVTALKENPANAPNPMEIAVLKRYFWRAGRTLRVTFMDGVPEVQSRVEAAAHEWSKYANIRFEFGNEPEAEIRISFQGVGSWSYVGTYALEIPKNEPTMNFGWLAPDTEEAEVRRVVLHEFGHALGCIHEHQHPENGIPWDVNKAYTFFAETQGWDKETVDVNVLGAFDKTVTQYSAFDPRSIMLYPVANELTVGDWEIPWLNSALSETDKTFIAQVYPRNTTFDAAVRASNGKLYFFQGDRYIRLTPGVGIDAGYPKSIAGHWRGMPAHFATGIDAVMAMPDNKLFFMREQEVILYTLGIGVDEGYPRHISDEWPEARFR